jgi:hypothetical protein
LVLVLSVLDRNGCGRSRVAIQTFTDSLTAGSGGGGGGGGGGSDGGRAERQDVNGMQCCHEECASSVWADEDEDEPSLSQAGVGVGVGVGILNSNTLQ